MKRILSLVLVLAMILAPMSAFAASDNRVITVPTVDDEKDFAADGDAPILRIEEKDAGEFGSTDGKDFRLELEGADFADEMFWSDAPTNTVTKVVYEIDPSTGNEDTTGAYIAFVKRTDTSAKAVLNVSSRNESTLVFEIPLETELDVTGEAKVTVDGMNTAVSSGTYTFAIGAGGDTVATVGSTETMERGDTAVGNILIDETIPGALGTGTQSFRLRLPSDFKWKSGTQITVDGFTANTLTVNEKAETFGSTFGASYTEENDGRDLIVSMNVTAKSTTTRGTIIIDPVVEATKDAEYGDVTVQLRGLAGDIANADDLVVGEYKDYGVAVSIDKVKTFLAGRVDESEYITGEIKIKENIEGSLLTGRVIDFELPSWVKLAQDRDGSNNSFDIKSNKTGLYNGADTNSVTINIDDNDMSKFSVEIAHTQPAKQEITFKLPITVKADQVGEIFLNVKGAGIEEQDLLIAEAVAPVIAEVEMADVKVGVQSQAAPDIIITETEAGAIRDTGYTWKSDGSKDAKVDPAMLLVAFKDDYGFNFDDAEYEVIEGDLEIDDDASDVVNKELQIAIKAESTKPSTIKISGIKLTLDRTVPEGPFQVDIKGSAVVDNPKYDDLTSRVARFDFANVVTKADQTEAKELKLTIDATEYTSLENGKEVVKSMDVAPYIDENSRTMVPVRFVAEALGAQVGWNGADREVQITQNLAGSGFTGIKLTIDEKSIVVNGTTYSMDTAAVIKDGRTFVPVRFVSLYLGADVQWDDATRTVTVTR